MLQWPYEAAAIAFEAIPRTLAQNCGVNVIRTMTTLRGKVRASSLKLFSGMVFASLFRCSHYVLDFDISYMVL